MVPWRFLSILIYTNLRFFFNINSIKKMAKARLIAGKVTVDGRQAVVPIITEVWLRKRNEGTVAFVANKDVHFGEAIKNGEALSKTGYRRVVIDKNGRLTPIVRMSTVGYMPDRGSYQLKREGDIVLSIYWGHGSDPAVVYEKDKDGIHDIEYDHRIKLSPNIDQFLQRAERGASFLTIDND